MVQLSHRSMTTGKTIAMAIQTFVGEVLGAYTTVTKLLSGLYISPDMYTWTGHVSFLKFRFVT